MDVEYIAVGVGTAHLMTQCLNEEKAMKAHRNRGTMRLDEPISWAELLGEQERPDELRFDGKAWSSSRSADGDEGIGEIWTRDWPSAVIIEIDPSPKTLN